MPAERWSRNYLLAEGEGEAEVIIHAYRSLSADLVPIAVGVPDKRWSQAKLVLAQEHALLVIDPRRVVMAALALHRGASHVLR
jgi:hypothetical protein